MRKVQQIKLSREISFRQLSEYYGVKVSTNTLIQKETQLKSLLKEVVTPIMI